MTLLPNMIHRMQEVSVLLQKKKTLVHWALDMIFDILSLSPSLSFFKSVSLVIF